MIGKSIGFVLTTTVLWAPVVGHAACADRPNPPAASQLNLTNKLYDLCPTVADVSFDPLKNSKLYNGVWWKKFSPADKALYRDHDNALEFDLGIDIGSVSPVTMKPGSIPLLSGAKPFYIEFEYKTLTYDADNFPAVWLMPIEHDKQMGDHYLGDPPKYERWQEIDVDEGGYAPGPMGTSIAWSDAWPNYKKVRSNPDLHNAPIDRTAVHRYAAAYDPEALTVTYYYDDQIQYVSKSPSVNEIVRKQHFYFIFSAQTKGKNVGYKMDLTRVRAFVGQ